jgi:predicted small metal-binding protein
MLKISSDNVWIIIPAMNEEEVIGDVIVGVKKFYKLDLINLDNCLKITKNIDIVFNLLGVKKMFQEFQSPWEVCIISIKDVIWLLK